jgi:Uma2 family endonuclease
MANVAAMSGTKQKPSGRRLPARRLFSVDEYYRMAEAGILGPDERVELIDGEIIEMAAMGSPHGGCVTALTQLMVLRVAEHGLVRAQLPVRLSALSEPEPDVALVRMRPNYYRDAHPTVTDIYLLIEVADSSLSFDRRRKLPLYAREGVPETWLVDLLHEQIEVYRRPENGRYQDVETFARGASLSPSAFPDLRITVDEILG